MTQEERLNNEQLWRLRMQEYQASGLTQKKWCEKEEIKFSSFRYWSKRLRQEDSQETAPDWLKVSMAETAPVASINLPQEHMQIQPLVSSDIHIYVEDISVEVPIGTPPDYISALLQAVRQK